MNHRLLPQDVELSDQPQPTRPSESPFDSALHAVERTIQTCSSNVEEIRRLHDQILHYCNPDEVNDVRQQVDSKTSQTNHMIKDANGQLKSLTEVANSEEDSTMRRMRLSEVNTNNVRLKGVVEEFQRVQLHFKDEYKRKLIHQRKLENPNAKELTDEDVDNLVRKGQTAFSMRLENDTRLTDAYLEIEEETREILLIEQSVVELAQLFESLHNLILEQGDLINSIEMNVEGAKEYVGSGVKQLEKANQGQQSARRKYCCLVILLLIVMLLVLGGIFW